MRPATAPPGSASTPANRRGGTARVAALLAEAACRGAAYNVRINVAAMGDKSRGAELVEEAKKLVAMTAKYAASATEQVEKHI